MNKLCILSVFLIKALLVVPTENARILGIFPTPSISHQVVYRALMKALSERGHHLTIMSTDPFKTDNPNITQIDWHSSYDIFRRGINFVEHKEAKKTEIDLMESFVGVSFEMMDEQLSHPEVRKIIDEKDSMKFDVVFVEYLNYLPFHVFSELFNAPLIGLTSLDTFAMAHEAVGNNANPIVHPEMLFPLFGTLNLQVIKFIVNICMFCN